MTPPRMTYPEHSRAVLRLGLPLIGGHLAQFAIGFTDTLVLGRYGVPELAALTLSASFFFTLFLFGSGFAWATLPMVATYAARENEVGIRRATRMALWLSGMYFLLVFPLLWFSGTILGWMGQEPEIAQLAQTYLRIAGWGLLPALGVMVFKNYLAGLEYTGMVLAITVLAAIVNLGANFVLVFGLLGFPEMGIAGAAIASLIVQVLSLGLVVLYALRVLPEHALLQRFWRPDWEMFREVFALGLPIGFTTLAEVALFAGTSIFMGWIDTVALAAHGVVLQISSATFMLQLGLSNAATARAGNALGLGDADHLFRGARVVMAMCLIGVALSVLLFLAFPEPLLAGFISPEEPQREAILALGRKLLMLAALFQLVDALQVLHVGLLRGLHDTRVPMWMATVAYWGVGMPAALLLGFTFDLGAVGVWLGLVVGLAVAAVLLMTRFWRRGEGLLGSAAAAAP